MRKTIIVIALIVIAASITFGVKSCHKKKDNNVQKVKTTVVQQGNMVVRVTETGSVEPKTTVEIKSKVGGEIICLPVKEGDRVRKGDLLVELDTIDLENRLKSTNADLEAARAKLSCLLAGERPQEIAKARESLKQAEIKLEDARLNLSRKKGLYDQGFISRQDVDTAQKEYELAQSSHNTASSSLSLSLEGAREEDITSCRASVLKAETAYEQAASDLNDARIYAPIDGTVLEKNVEEGEKVTSGIGNTGGGTIILTIGDLSTMKILTKINEVDINKVRIGQDVEITLDAIRGEKYHGLVTDIASIGKVENNIVTYEVVVEIGRGRPLRLPSFGRGRPLCLPSSQQSAGGSWQSSEGRRQQAVGRRQSPVGSRQLAAGSWRSHKSDMSDPSDTSDPSASPLLKPGMTADVDIITARKTDILYVPLEAVIEHGGKRIVLVAKGDKFTPRRIKTGLQDETRVEIIEGLTAGERVKLKSQAAKKGKNDSSTRPRMMGHPPGMGMGRR